jgi:hypothetical protein
VLQEKVSESEFGISLLSLTILTWHLFQAFLYKDASANRCKIGKTTTTDIKPVQMNIDYSPSESRQLAEVAFGV